MSTWTNQYIFYGVKVSYKEYQEAEEALESRGVSDAYDVMNAANHEEGSGWLVDGMNGGFALVGQIIMRGEDAGNDNLLAAESGTLPLNVLNQNQCKIVQAAVDKQLGRHEQCQYHVVCMYS